MSACAGSTATGSRGIRALPGRIPLEEVVLQARSCGYRGFSGEGVLALVSPCRWGRPRAVLSHPLRRGLPFPTLFWLVCPHLVREVSRLEASGGVREASELARRLAPELRLHGMEQVVLRFQILSPAQRGFLRRRARGFFRSLKVLGGGGRGVKCLHSQVASLLALGWHPLGPFLLERIPSMECEVNVCGGLRRPGRGEQLG